MDDLPLEILHEIAYNRHTYRALLAVPKFANSLTPSTRCDYMIRFGYCVEITRNVIQWTLNGELHRTNGPAVSTTDGEKMWWINGKLHRTDGPAIIWANGTQWWYKDGKLHRTDGPAVIYVDGYQAWYIHGNQVIEQEFNNLKS
jgi:hypothetical protein